MNNEYDKTKHLEMIQGIINRLSGKSTSVKSWCITLISALLIFSERSKEFRIYFILIVALPLISFCFLDTFYLIMERRYRELYEEVRMGIKKDYDLKIERKVKWLNYGEALMGTSQKWFYIPTITILTLIIFFYGLGI